MKNVFLLIFAGLIFSFSFSNANADELDNFISSQMQTYKIPGVAIAITKQDKIIIRRDYGQANLETETPVKPGTVFDLASVTKSFTASAIMLLVQDGKLKLDDHINTYIKEAPDTWKDITIRHLLSHTSGIRGGGWVECDGSPLLNITSKRYLQDFINSPLLFAPGQGAEYSDPGYFLLGMIIEKVSGIPYRDFMKKRIFEPAGMASTRIIDRLEIVKGHASCYALRHGTLENDRRIWQFELASSFGMQSTADDLAKWAIALNNFKLLTKESLEQMWTPAKLQNGTLARVDGDLYGLGYFIQDVNDLRAVGHPGFHGSLLFQIPDKKIGIIVLTNLDIDKNPHHLNIAMGIMQRLDSFINYSPNKSNDDSKKYN